MAKKGLIISVIVLIAIVATVFLTLFLCGVFDTPKMEVYNLVTQNEIVKDAKTKESEYEILINQYNTTQNIPDIKKVNDLHIITTTVVEELTNYARFVENTKVKSKPVRKSYEEYVNAKSYADAKLNEAKNTTGGDYISLFDELLERYSKQAVKYNKFCNALLNYVNNACFVSSPKTLKYTILQFSQGFNSTMIEEYVAPNKLKTNTVLGIGINGKIIEKYEILKEAEQESTSALALNFVKSFYEVENIKAFYKAYSAGATALNNYVEDKTNYNAKTVFVQQTHCRNVEAFIIQGSYV